MWMDTHEHLRQGLAAHSRPPHFTCMSPGTQVYFHKVPQTNVGRRRLEDELTGWTGPAIVINVEGPEYVWVKYRRDQIRVAVENVRLASPEETLGHRHVMEALTDMESRLFTGEREVKINPKHQVAEEEVVAMEPDESPAEGLALGEAPAEGLALAKKSAEVVPVPIPEEDIEEFERNAWEDLERAGDNDPMVVAEREQMR